MICLSTNSRCRFTAARRSSVFFVRHESKQPADPPRKTLPTRTETPEGWRVRSMPDKLCDFFHYQIHIIGKSKYCYYAAQIAVIRLDEKMITDSLEDEKFRPTCRYDRFWDPPGVTTDFGTHLALRQILGRSHSPTNFENQLCKLRLKAC